MQSGNLYRGIPDALPEEILESLILTPTLRIERILSKGQSSAPDFWYDQEQHEWVVLLKGEARLRFSPDDRIVHLTPGDYVNIPAHVKHRVDWTTPDEESVWLAIFY